MFGLGTPELIVIAIIVLVLFGAGGIPQIARALGQTRRELKQIQEEIQKPVQDIQDALEQSLPLTEPPLLVFVSSVMNPQCEDLKPERAAAKKAIEAFPPLTRAWRFEDSPASPEGVGRVYLDKVKQCDIFVLVVGKDITRPVIKEYATAKRNDKLCLVFLKKGTRELATEAFIRKVRSHVKYVEFESDVDLDYQIWRSVAALLIEGVRRFKLSASDAAALALFLNELPKLGLSEPRIEISEPEASPTEQPDKASSRIKLGRDGKRMILIPAGWFWRGTSEADILDMLIRFKASRGWFEDEIPQRRIYLDTYSIDETPVTNAEYKRFLDAHRGHSVPYGWDATWRTYPDGKANHPVVNVSWSDANDYAHWAGKRLPTEAQWEKAARGTDGRRYPWGNAEPDATRCNFNYNEKGTASVGNYPRGNSPYGVMDMAGNVWEWCADWYDPNYYSSSPRENPKGPISGSSRVLRGGSFNNDQDSVRAAIRDLNSPDYRGDCFGFRCAQ